MKHFDLNDGLLAASFISAVYHQTWQSVFVFMFCVTLFSIIIYLNGKKQNIEHSEVMSAAKALEKRIAELERIASTTSLGQAFRPTRK